MVRTANRPGGERSAPSSLAWRLQLAGSLLFCSLWTELAMAWSGGLLRGSSIDLVDTSPKEPGGTEEEENGEVMLGGQLSNKYLLLHPCMHQTSFD